MSRLELSRRNLLGLGSAAALTAALPPMLGGRAARAQSLPPIATATAETLLGSINSGFDFQNFMMDAYAAGSTVRLTQSYSDEAVGPTAFTYDNAVAIHAYLAAGDVVGDRDDIARAQILGQGLLYAQANNFPIADGRLAQAYYVNVPASDGSGAFITPAAAPYYFYTSAVGDQAWAGMALAQLASVTGDNKYLAGALLLGNWIVNNTFDTTGPGGFRFGTNINQYNQSVPSTNGKSTEHNIDTFAFFTMLDTLTGGGSAANGMSWSALAAHAAAFVLAMYSPSGPFFYTGTLPDLKTINTFPIPEDCQTWSFLASLNPVSKGTIDYALANLSVSDSASAPRTSLTGSQSISGLAFSSAGAVTATADPDAVWLEGTSHTIAALLARVLSGNAAYPYGVLSDLEAAFGLIQQAVYAQQNFGLGKKVGGKAIPTGLGLVAASSVLDTGFGYTYGPSLHIGATGWYLLGVIAANPCRLGYRVIVSAA